MRSPPTLVRVVVADHHPMVRAGFVALVGASAGMTVVGEAGDGGEAIHVVLATHPDVVLLDAALPVVDGIETTRRLLDAHEGSPGLRPRILMVATVTGDEYAYEGLRAGASGFVPRDARHDELICGIRIAAADDGLVGPHDLLRLIAEFTPTDPEAVDVTGRLAMLVDHEVRMLTAVAGGYDDATIARHLGVEQRRVADSIAAIGARLGLVHRTELVLFAFRCGVAPMSRTAVTG